MCTSKSVSLWKNGGKVLFVALEIRCVRSLICSYTHIHTRSVSGWENGGKLPFMAQFKNPLSAKSEFEFEFELELEFQVEPTRQALDARPE